MKKLISLVLAAALLVCAFSLASCTDDSSSETPASGDDTGADTGDSPIAGDIVVPDVTMNYPAYSVYRNSVEEGSQDKVPTSANLSSWFAETTEFDEDFNILTPAAFEHISEYVLHMPEGRSAVEVCIFKVADSGDAAAVKALAEYRKVKVDGSDIRLYDESADELLEFANAFVLGPFAIYVCTEDTAVSVLRAQKFYSENPNCSALELYKAIVSDIK